MKYKLRNIKKHRATLVAHGNLHAHIYFEDGLKLVWGEHYSETNFRVWALDQVCGSTFKDAWKVWAQSQINNHYNQALAKNALKSSPIFYSKDRGPEFATTITTWIKMAESTRSCWRKSAAGIGAVIMQDMKKEEAIKILTEYYRRAGNA